MEIKSVILEKIFEEIKSDPINNNTINYSTDIFEKLFQNKTPYEILATKIPNNTSPIVINLFDLSENPRSPEDQANSGNGVWYQDNQGYGSRIKLSSKNPINQKEIDKYFFKDILSKIRMNNYQGYVGVNLCYSNIFGTFHNLLYFQNNKICRFTPPSYNSELFPDQNNYYQRNIDGALYTYFNENSPDFKYFSNHQPIPSNYLTMPFGNESYCLLYLNYRMDNQDWTHEITTKYLLSESSVLNQLFILWKNLIH